MELYLNLYRKEFTKDSFANKEEMHRTKFIKDLFANKVETPYGNHLESFKFFNVDIINHRYERDELRLMNIIYLLIKYLKIFRIW